MPPQNHKKPAKRQAERSFARFEPRSPSQALGQRLYAQRDVLFLVGPAGCGKTQLAAGLAAVDALSGGPRDRLVVLRPAVEADRGLGFLPGTLDEKLAPFTQPVRQALAKVVFNPQPGLVSFDAVGFARGVTYENSVVVLDEAQNASWAQLKLVITRLGRGSKLIVTGDPDQSDIRSTGSYLCDLDEVVDDLRGVPGVGVVEFPEHESLRHPILGPVLKAMGRRR